MSGAEDFSEFFERQIAALREYELERDWNKGRTAQGLALIQCYDVSATPPRLISTRLEAVTARQIAESSK